MSDSRGPVPDLRVRPAEPDDMAACTRLWDAAIGDYVRRLNQPWFPGELLPLERLLGHLLETDPDGFRVATVGDDREPAAFVSAHHRGNVWFLAMLFVRPDLQGRGVGRMLLEQVLPQHADANLVLGTATDSAQPISNALYAEYGIVPRMPVWRLVGRVEREDALEALPDDIVPELLTGRTEAPDDVHAIDREVLGYDRPRDHGFLLRDEGRTLVVYRRGGDVVGYGYGANVGRIGPQAALDASLMAPITAHLLSVISPAGAYASWVPGAAGPLTAMLLRAGFRLEPFPMLFCWTAPLADFERYVPISGALI